MNFINRKANGDSTYVRHLPKIAEKQDVSAKGIFVTLHQRHRKLSNFRQLRTTDCRATRCIRTSDVEENVLDKIDKHFVLSTLMLCYTCFTWVNGEFSLSNPFHVLWVRTLIETDFNPRIRFCWNFNYCASTDILDHLPDLWIIEFSKDSIMNYHNDSKWNDQKPHVIK